MRHYLVIMCLGLILSGLNGCKLVNRAADENQEVVGRRVLQEVKAQQAEFKTMTISGKVRVEAPGGGFSGLSASYRIDLRRDSLLVLKVTKFIEVARVKIDQDSIYIIDRLNGALYVCDFSLAEKYTGLKADFQALHDLLLGNFNPIPATLKAENVKTLPYTFTGEEAGMNFRYFIDPLISKLLRIQANNPETGLGSDISYTEFEPAGETVLPRLIEINAISPDTINLELDHRRIDVDGRKPSFELGDLSGLERKGCDF